MNRKSHDANRKHNMLTGLLAALVLLATTGCQKVHTDYSAFLSPEALHEAAKDYRLAPPDVVTVSSKLVREIDGHTEIIRPDGKITLPLLGTVHVDGKTPEQVSSELQHIARDYYEDADVSLRVSAFNSKKIFIFGEVSVPGALPWRGNNTVLGTLALTQPTRLADPAKIQVLRPNSDGKLVRRMTIDMNRMVQEGETEHDAVLLEGDIIYVPPNPLAAVGLAFQQVLLPVQPAASTVAGPADIATDLRTRPYGDERGTGN